MEPLIAVLAPHVIDQIAAGEVIERPASVVKELVDNAIDAAASAIAIEVAGGGRALVRVTDDGTGMSAKDAVLALERHATSKLREVDDLWGIASMGFRGEALPSIASVSRMILTTRRAGDDAATRITVEAGRLISVTEVGAAVGTTVEVADLLHNLPARLKFLKGEATEASHITELVGKIAMAYPRLHLRLKHNGRTALDVPPDRDGFSRAQALLGPRIAARLVPVMGEESGVRVTGYLAAPELAQATARGVQLFVGRRPVRDRNLLHALAMGYGELVPRGRYPLAVVLVDVPAGAVDVNVHPQKLEVRFSDAAVVAAAVRHVVQAGVHRAGWRSEAGGAGPVHMIASVAPPVLPFDGRATQLAEHHVAQMKSRQVSLGFAAPEVAAAGSTRSFVSRVTATPPAPASPPAAATAPAVSPRDWARALREQTRAARHTEPGADQLVGDSEIDRGRGNGSAGAAGGLLAGLDRAQADGDHGSAGAAGGVVAGLAGFDRAQVDGDHGSAGAAGGLVAGLAGLERAQADGDHGSAGAAGGVVAGLAGLAGIAGIDRPGRAQDSGDADGFAGGPAADGDAAASSASAGRTGAFAFAPAPAPAPGSASQRPAAASVPGFFAQLRYLGQLDLTYLVCEADGELVLVDQHAAHERVELARLRARQHHGGEGGDGRVAVQKLLFPITFEATPEWLALIDRVGDVLARAGFEVEPFGKATLAVKAVPANLRHGDPAELLQTLLHQWSETGAPSDAERLDALLGEIACHSVVRAGDRLTTSEAETLLRSLDGVDLSLPAPHGRAVLLRLPLTEIGRRFGR